MAPTAIPNEEWSLAEYLIQQVTKKCSGELEHECYLNKPSDVYFIGNFRPIPSDEDDGYNREILQKLSPSAFGAEYKLNAKGDFSASISFTWSCYYRVFPTRDEQQKWMSERQRGIEIPEFEKTKVLKEEEDELMRDPTLIKSFAERERKRRSSEELYSKFKKINCSASGKIAFTQRDFKWEINAQEIQESIYKEISRIKAIIQADQDRIKETKKGKIKVTNENIQSEEKYRAFINSFKDEVDYDWKWDTGVQLIEWDDKNNIFHLLIYFVNTSSNNLGNPNFEPFLFNPSAEFEFLNTSVVSFDLELATESFRYDRELWGKGFNCGVLLKKDEASGQEKYITTHTPICRQNRYKTKEQPEAPFKDLDDSPEKVLKNILEKMKADLVAWDAEEKNYEKQFRNWNEKYQSQYESDKKCFEKEIERFELGLSLIQKDSDIKLAFQLTNRTFANAGKNSNPHKEKTKWRLFQIVFLVTQIPGIAALNPEYEQYKNEREIVDIVYFPTGGGKTEAYLATLIFNAFYDRIRGKRAGVTSWIRFPLRLLTVQQTQRLTDIIGNAELVRSSVAKENKKLEGSRFSVGYYVGSGSTPNVLSPTPQWNEHNWSIANDANERQEWKRVFSCPSCKSNNVRVEFDATKIKLLHKCQEPSCKFPNGELPIYIVDEEIYRYLPTVIVGTIDKLASIGIDSNLAMIFGKVDGYCNKHGYFNGKCTRFDCKSEKELTRKKIQGLTGPSLFIQDELHLLKEGLGTFDSHYETFAQYLLKEFSEKAPLKIIASSATIEEYKRQARHLYGRENARVFPGKGPSLRESFYANTFDFPQRIFVGILPHNKTIFNTILEIIETYHGIIHSLKSLSGGSTNPYNGSYSCGSEDWKALIDKYRTSLTYFLAGRELDSVKTDIEHYINPKFQKDGITPLMVKELTGGTSTDAVTQTLSLLERKHTFSESEESVLATSMISHGVDVDRMNTMIFYGMPRQNAEYIQASSRVGRTHVGIVFNCLHPIRERDQSHFAYFEKYHEFLGQLVEPVAINRWSTYSVDRTLPGLFMAALLQVIANQKNEKDIWKFGRLDHVGKLLSSGELNDTLFKTILREGYQINVGSEPRDKLFDEKIENRIIKYLDSIKRKSHIYTKVKEVLSPSPMTSLRDVDESIPIELDSAGSDWLSKKRLKDD